MVTPDTARFKVRMTAHRNHGTDGFFKVADIWCSVMLQLLSELNAQGGQDATTASVIGKAQCMKTMIFGARAGVGEFCFCRRYLPGRTPRVASRWWPCCHLPLCLL